MILVSWFANDCPDLIGDNSISYGFYADNAQEAGFNRRMGSGKIMKCLNSLF